MMLYYHFVHVNAISFMYKISILFLCDFHYLLLYSHILFVLQCFFGICSYFRIYKMTYYVITNVDHMAFYYVHQNATFHSPYTSVEFM